MILFFPVESLTSSCSVSGTNPVPASLVGAVFCVWSRAALCVAASFCPAQQPAQTGLTSRPSLDIIVPEEPDGGTLWALCAGSVETPASDVVTSGFFFFVSKGKG